jgi:hypothetical protein
MRTILLIVLVLLLIGALPAWPYSTGWGYYPSGGLGLILLILIILAVMGRILDLASEQMRTAFAPDHHRVRSIRASEPPPISTLPRILPLG